jgi:phospholipid-binding lipoprotein MlaA
MEFKVYDGNPPIVIDDESEDEIDAFLDELDAMGDIE